MAYNYPLYQSPYLQMPQMPQMQQQQTSAVTGSRNSDFVLVRSEAEARNYPVAYGNTVTFKDENEPYMYTKTMGLSQLDRPIFEKYKLVKEMPQEATQTSEEVKRDNEAIDKLKSEIGAIWKEIEALKKKSNVKKVLDDESV